VRRDCAPHRGPWLLLLASVNGFGIAVAVVAWMLGWMLFDRPMRLEVNPAAFGFLGYGLLVLCLPLGLFTWVLAARDLARMRGGDMDPAGLRAATLPGWAGIAGMAVGAIPTLVAVLLLLS
jgi:hypothetical protein